MLASRHLLTSSLTLLASGALAFAVSDAQAQSSCDSDADCSKGLQCAVVGGSDCAVAPCPEGAECPIPPDCERSEMKACVPGASCESDADCGADMVCFEQTYQECRDSEPPCPEGSDCVEPMSSAPSDCTTQTQRSCIPKYAAPCQVASDCGEGFKCVEVESCGCSGSSSGESPPSGGGGTETNADLPLAEDCSCAPSGVFKCEPVAETCSADGDCPADWTCEDHGVTSSTTCADPVSKDPSADGPACEETEPVVTHDYQCTPPNWGYWGSPGVPEGSATDDKSSGAQTADGESDTDVSSSDGCHVSRTPTTAFKGLALSVLALFGIFRRRGAKRR